MYLLTKRLRGSSFDQSSLMSAMTLVLANRGVSDLEPGVALGGTRSGCVPC